MTTEWTHAGIPVTEIDPEMVGFIYIITNMIDGRKYIGKKNAFFKKTKYKVVTQKNGKKVKKKIRSLVPSDWPTYFGSSVELQNDVEKLGQENFSREIVRFCKTASEMSYYEAHQQFTSDALLHPTKFYNSWIMCRVRRDHLLKNENSTTFLDS